MAYEPTIWEDEPSTDTPVSAANLQNIETGIDQAHVLLDGATDAPTGLALARRDEAGRLQVAAPTTAAHVATRGYVDGKIVSITQAAYDALGTKVAGTLYAITG